MQQKYKVFINDKIIIINNLKDALPIADYDYIYENDNNLKNRIAEFANSPLSKLNIYADDTEFVFKRFFYVFDVIIASGGVVMKKTKNSLQYLFIFRKNKWDLPKGKLDKNEVACTAAKREIKEECGISGMRIIKSLSSTYHMYLLNNEWVIKKTYWYLMLYNRDEKLFPQIEENITEIKWFNENELNIPLSNTYLSIKDLVENEILKKLNSQDEE